MSGKKNRKKRRSERFFAKDVFFTLDTKPLMGDARLTPEIEIWIQTEFLRKIRG
jgi:hypothetical protein